MISIHQKIFWHIEIGDIGISASYLSKERVLSSCNASQSHILKLKLPDIMMVSNRIYWILRHLFKQNSICWIQQTADFKLRQLSNRFLIHFCLGKLLKIKKISFFLAFWKNTLDKSFLKVKLDRSLFITQFSRLNKVNYWF